MRIEAVPLSLKISRIKELPKDDFLLIGDTLQDVIILPNENKMKGTLGKNVKVSLPESFQTNKEKPKRLADKAVKTDITDDEFRISYAKAERLRRLRSDLLNPKF